MYDLHSCVHCLCADSQIIFLEIYIYFFFFLPAVLHHSSWSIFKGRVEIWIGGHVEWQTLLTESSNFLGSLSLTDRKPCAFIPNCCELSCLCCRRIQTSSRIVLLGISRGDLFLECKDVRENSRHRNLCSSSVLAARREKMHNDTE